MTTKKDKKEKTTVLSVLKPLLRLYSLTLEHSGWAVVRILGGAASAGLGVFSSWLMGNVVDVMIEVTDTGNTARLVDFAWLVLIFFVCRGVVNYCNPLLGKRYSLYSGRKIRSLAIDKINRLPISFFENTHSAEVVSRLANDIDSLQNYYGNSVGGIWSFIPTMLTASIWVMVKINPLLTLLCCCIIPPIWYIVNKIAIPIGDASKRQQEHIAEYNSYLRDFLEGIHIYISYNMKRIFSPKFNNACDKAYKEEIEIARKRARATTVNVITFITPQILAYGIGSIFVSKGAITIGELVIFAQLIFPFLNATRQLIFTWQDWLIHSGKARHFFEILDTENEREDGDDYSGSSNGTVVEFNNTQFEYNENTPVFTDVSFKVGKQQKVAFVGASGGGKTTVFKMILGYYSTFGGSVSFLGHDINDWNLSSLRSNIAVVNQEVYLFNDTFMENIRIGRPDATDEEVKEAARKAYAEEFILEKESGYDTCVGERGGSLSGGQRQRIAIARAILKDAPVLLLDEPTSALDTKAEHYVQKALERLEEGKTVLVIAHRLSTIENADNILVIEQGHVVESGTHTELCALNGRYSELYRHQLEEQEVPGEQ